MCYFMCGLGSGVRSKVRKVCAYLRSRNILSSLTLSFTMALFLFLFCLSFTTTVGDTVCLNGMPPSPGLSLPIRSSTSRPGKMPSR